MKHVLIVNRWDDAFGDYRTSVDHATFAVSYVTNRAGAALPRSYVADADRIVEVADLGDRATVIAAARGLADRFGPVDAVLALSEWDIDTGGAVRDALGTPGPGESECMVWRDKVRMKERVLASGLAVPRWGSADEQTWRRLADECGFPLVLKPRTGAASAGVAVVRSPVELESVLARYPSDGYECEEFVEGPIYHVDGVTYRGSLAYAVVSRYVNTCYHFAGGLRLGSYTTAEGARRDELLAFTRASLDALSLTDSAFHLEIICRDDVEPVFLEVGARVGGGEIPFVLREVHGVDMVADWVAVQLGNPPAGRLRHGVSTGFVMVPEPRPLPARVTARTSLVGRIPTLYAELLPDVGELFDGSGGYDHIGGRFRFSGTDAAEVERAVRATIDAYVIEAEPVTSRPAALAGR
jgi:biotin carboxylase